MERNPNRGDEGLRSRQKDDPDGDIEEIRESRREIYLPLSMRGRLLLLQAVFLAMVVLATNAVIMQTLNRSVGPTPNDTLQGPEVHALFQDDFDYQDTYWYRWEEGTGTASIRDGCAFLNLNQTKGGAVAALDDMQGGRGHQWLHVSIEVRLRCSDDGKLEGDLGGATRAWGFADSLPTHPENHLWFASCSPESDPSLEGFLVQVAVNNSLVLSRPVIGIDVRQWHNYTILWEPGNATFLVDDELILTTEEVPEVPMGMVVLTSNWVYRGPLYPGGNLQMIGLMDLEHDSWIQVDRVDAFLGSRQLAGHSEIAGRTLSAAPAIILEAEQKGMDTEKMRDDLVSATEALQKDGYIPAQLHSKVIAIAEILPEYLDELADLFSDARNRIEDPATDPGDARIMEAHYASAEKAWDNYDFPLTKTHLQRILEM